jgi:hypothetical protein
LWSAVTPRRKEGCAAEGPELGNRTDDETTGDETSNATSTNGRTAAMLAFAPVKPAEDVAMRTATRATRRVFLGMSAGAVATTRIELAVRDPGVRTRRLDMGFYARDIDIPSV